MLVFESQKDYSRTVGRTCRRNTEPLARFAQTRPKRTIGAEPTQHPATATLPSQKARRLLIAKQSAARARVQVVGSGTAAEFAESAATMP